MQKIIIKNFGPIKDAEIEIKKILVLIGEQASGKSTIAKLIYFFSSLNNDFDSALNDDGYLELKTKLDFFSKNIKRKLFNFFPTVLNNPNFYVRHYFSESTFIEIKHKVSLTNEIDLALDEKIVVNFSLNFNSPNFLPEFHENNKQGYEIGLTLKSFTDIKELTSRENEMVKLWKKNTVLVDRFFDAKFVSKLYLSAGREATISLENIFDVYFERTFNNQFDNQRTNSQKISNQTYDEHLILQFYFKIRYLKSLFEKYGGNFKDVINNLKNDSKISPELIKKINSILKGDYRIDSSGEKLVLENGESISLKDASTGQKEVIRIIQDLVLCILENENSLRIIEEPETHLFPVAQKQLIELLVYMKNFNPNNQIIITTHSPYILTVFNNLLFASRVIAKAPQSETEVNAKIPKVFHVDPNDFAAYSLGNSSDIESNYCEEIFSKETGLIDQNYLDIVSEILGDEFNYLYSLYAKNLRATV